jgi:hypothetical protein
MRLTADEHELLHDLARCTQRPSVLSFKLEARGLAVNGSGRFGGWARITDKGRLALDSAYPEAAPGLAESASSAGHSFRGAGPRMRRTPATKRSRI